MEKDLKFNIISEGQKNGISSTCRKYKISRTIYYKWLKKYQSLGIDGLDNTKKNFAPINKTNEKIEKAILNLIRTYPHYGPRAIKYLLEEIDYHISESAVFNVMKRHNITNRKRRLDFAKKKSDLDSKEIIPTDNLIFNESWLFWITDYGCFKNIGNLYEYTFIDPYSKISCSRLYPSISYTYFEDLLTAVALPIAQTLNLNAKYLCFFNDTKITQPSFKDFKSKLNLTLNENGFDMTITLLKDNTNIDALLDIRSQYTKSCMDVLLPLLNEGLNIEGLKSQLQQHVRNYNINNNSLYDSVPYSPIEYHNQITNSKLILPIWAYIDRQY